MSDSLRRSLRTLVQGLTGGLVTGLLDLFLVELTDTQALGLGAVLTVLSAFFMNLLEDKAGMYAIAYPGGKKPTVKK